MLINLISQSNYQSYNVEVAKIFGLYSAVYLNALIEINEKAIRKDKLYDEHFLIDRKYITERTTLTISQQKSIEKDLESVDIIHKNNDDCIKVNVDVLTGLIMTSDESIKEDLSYLRNAKKDKEIKSASILNAVKQHINPNYPEDMKQAYREWLDVIQNKMGFVSKQMVLEAQKCVDKEANHDVDTALQIIHIASANGWKDMNYAVQVYKQRNNKLTQVKQNTINISEETF